MSVIGSSIVSPFLSQNAAPAPKAAPAPQACTQGDCVVASQPQASGFMKKLGIGLMAAAALGGAVATASPASAFPMQHHQITTSNVVQARYYGGGYYGGGYYGGHHRGGGNAGAVIGGMIIGGIIGGAIANSAPQYYPVPAPSYPGGVPTYGGNTWCNGQYEVGPYGNMTQLVPNQWGGCTRVQVYP